MYQAQTSLIRSPIASGAAGERSEKGRWDQRRTAVAFAPRCTAVDRGRAVRGGNGEGNEMGDSAKRTTAVIPGETPTRCYGLQFLEVQCEPVL